MKNYYRDQLAKVSTSPISAKFTDADSNATNYLDVNAESIPEIIDYLYLVDGYETGAPTHECNDFVLTAMNDQDCYNLLLGGYSAKELYKHNSYLNTLDLDQLDFTWINRYLKEHFPEK